MNKQHVCVAMSGGVDSAGAALLLRREGCEVYGVTMDLHSCKDRPGLCGCVSGCPRQPLGGGQHRSLCGQRFLQWAE